MVLYGETRLLKTHSQVRKDQGVAIPQSGSQYLRYDEMVDRERDERVFAPLQIPKAIESNLPFKSKQKVMVL